LIDSVEGYIHALYWQSVPTRIVSGQMLAEGDLEGLRLLVTPSPYYVTEAEAVQLDAWVRRGGVAFVGAHLAGYNGTTGRRSRVLPGCGLVEAWGFRETETTAVRRLPIDGTAGDFRADLGDGGVALTEDVKKALAHAGAAGKEVFLIGPLADSRAVENRRTPAALQAVRDPALAVLARYDQGAEILWGADRYAELDGDGLQVLGTAAGRPVLVAKPIGDGYVIYAGSRLGQGAGVDRPALSLFLERVVALAGITPPLSAAAPSADKVHVDLLRDAEGRPRFLVVVNRDAEERRLCLDWEGEAHALFTKTRWALAGKSQVTIPGLFIDLFELVSRVSWSLWVHLALFRIGSRVTSLHSTTFLQGVTQTYDQVTRSSAAGMGRPERPHRSHDRRSRRHAECDLRDVCQQVRRRAPDRCRQFLQQDAEQYQGRQQGLPALHHQRGQVIPGQGLDRVRDVW